LGYPEKVRSMILVSGWARPDAYLKELFGLWICLAENLNLDATWMDALLWSFSHRMYNERLEEIEALKKGVGEADMSVGSFVRQARACISHDATDRLHGVKAPTLILVGAEDIFTPYRLARDLHRAIPKSTLKVLDDQAHAFPIENPQVLIQEIRDFVLTQRADK
jgi:pimeloyl-ACP methyl ester carboxylesterase